MVVAALSAAVPAAEDATAQAPDASRFSSLATLTPRLRAGVRIHRHRYRGERWYVLEDLAKGAFHRFGPREQRAMTLIDGQRSVEAIAAAITAADEGEGEADTREWLVGLLDALTAHELLDWNDRASCPVAASERARAMRSARRRARLRAPHIQRFALLDPDGWLERRRPVVERVFSRAGAIAWAALVLGAATLLAASASELAGYFALRSFTPASLVALWALYALVKGVHELAHACAVKRWGGPVREMGVMLLLMMPLPYVDASAASAFADKRRRIVVGAAGIMAELALAAVAALVWLAVETGVVRDLAYGVMLIGGLSTLLFNGNPLLRFDGYYVLADAIEIPNLGSRASRYYGYLVRRHLLGVPGASSPVTAPGEAGWFLGYGLVSWLYRMAILLGIALLLAAELGAIGVVIAVWVVAGQLVPPLLRAAGAALRAPAEGAGRTRAAIVLGALVALPVLALGVVPAPLHTRAQGVVWLAERAEVRAGTGGFVARVLAEPGQPVRQGDPLFVLEDAELVADAESLRWEIAELEARRDEARAADPVDAALIGGELEQSRRELVELETRIGQLVLESPVSGNFVAPEPRHAEGRFVRQGSSLGFVVEPAAATVRVALAQAQIGHLRRSLRAVHVRLAGPAGDALPARLAQAMPSAGRALPSPALGVPGGGSIPVDPRDETGLTALESVFQVELEVPGLPATEHVGRRVHVRFEHAPEPLAGRLWRATRRLLLRRLDV